MNEFLTELNRRGVLRTGSAYIVLGWLMVQVAGIMVPAMDLPDVVLSVTTAFLVLCFPIVILISWLVDVTADGIRLTTAIRAEQKLAQEKAEQARSMIDVDETAFESEQLHIEEGHKAIAVLPFRDKSLSRDQEHISNGVAEEIRNILSRVEGLHVLGRVSSRAFKGQKKDAREIGKLLHANYILEGNIVRQNDRLNVTAQLINVDSGFQLWSKAYSRSLKDIFDIQEEVAAAIATELGFAYSREAKDETAKRLTANERAYSLYMRGRTLMLHRAQNNVGEAMDYFDQAVELDPNFARAWAAKAEAHIVSAVRLNKRLSEAQAAAERCCRQAIAIDPRFAAPHAVLANVFMQHRAYTAMQECLDKALEIDSDDRMALHHSGVAMMNVGRINEAGRFFQRLHDIDPMMPFSLSGIAVARLLMGDLEAAEKYASRVSTLGFAPAYLTLAEVAFNKGDLEKAAANLTQGMQGDIVHEFSSEQLPILARAVYFEDVRPQALEIVEDYVRDPAPETEVFAPYFLMRYGKISEAFDVFARNKFAFDAHFLASLWSPSSKEVRQHPGFKEFVQRIGLVDYWHQYGWADKCRPINETDYEVD